MEMLEINKYNTQEIMIELTNYEGYLDELNFVVEDVQKNTMFIKTLNNGIKKSGDNQYIISIKSEDTKNMNILYKYNFFVEIIVNGEVVETTNKGIFKVNDSSNNLKEVIE